MEQNDGVIRVTTFEQLVDLMLNASPEQLESLYEQIDAEIARREQFEIDEIVRKELSN